MSEWEKVRNWSHARKVAYAKAVATVRYADGRIEIYPTAKAAMARAANLRTSIAAYAGTKPIKVKRLDPDGCFTWRPADIQSVTAPQSGAQ